MCGIAGTLRLDGASPTADSLGPMLLALAHRGPDGEGRFAEGPVAVGHRRLAILDLTEAGRQPMEDSTGRFVVTYNGEIYNYLELRAELEALGVRFRSRSDTEVLLEGYARWGPEVVGRLNGMFAFAMWDRRERVLFCARDRFGEKPLYYCHAPGREFRFASEIKALVRPREGAGRPRESSLYEFLAWGHCGNTGGTFFEGVEQVPPAHTLTLRDGRPVLQRYWSLPESPRFPEGSDEDAARGIRDRIRESVRLRLRSDVPVGTSLSGGLDSSTVVGFVALLLQEGRAEETTRRAAFTASLVGTSVDETAFADAAAAAAGAEAHRVVPTAEDLLEHLPRIVETQEEPFGGPGIYAQWKVMSLARDNGVVVLLDGQGGDEVFAGYGFLFQDYWWSLLRGGRLSSLREEMREYDGVHGSGSARRLLQAGLRARAPRWLSRLKGGPDIPWLTGDFARRARRDFPAPPDDLRGSLRGSQASRMLPHLLRFADRNSMAFSREVRLPFLDHELVAAVDALPDRFKLRGGTSKWILREAIRGVVPDVVRTRRDKLGFAVPFHEWMRGALDPLVRDTIGSSRFRERGLHDVKELVATRRRLHAGEDSAAVVLWNALSMELWMRAFVDGPSGQG